MDLVLMVAVALAASSEAARPARRARYFRQRATLHALTETRCLRSLAAEEARIVRKRDRSFWRERLERQGIPADAKRLDSLTTIPQDDLRRGAGYRREAEYHRKMKEKFERAAGRPWETVVIDSIPCEKRPSVPFRRTRILLDRSATACALVVDDGGRCAGIRTRRGDDNGLFPRNSPRTLITPSRPEKPMRSNPISWLVKLLRRSRPCVSPGSTDPTAEWCIDEWLSSQGLAVADATELFPEH
jgi:hypothetical protein